MRIIPALAGNTWPGSFDDGTARDHPRSRGEYQTGRAFGVHCHGSSPLSRGIRCSETSGCAVRGIIPALAGNTIEPAGPVLPAGDHPRSRGEYAPAARMTISTEGSSPLSRGIHTAQEHALDRRRIIPALAGNTMSAIELYILFPDHPRSRGEYTAAVTAAQNPTGSSPLSRGIRCGAYCSSDHGRIIPALAGNTASIHCGWCTVRDHPRSRGEYGRCYVERGHLSGSSPLSRGILIGAGPITDGPRIIPALAGNTSRVPRWPST